MIELEKIGERQEMFLRCCWESGGSTTALNIKKWLKKNEGVDLTKSAINDMLKVLVRKGYLELAEKNPEAYVYRATISQEDYVGRELAETRRKFFGNSIPALLTGFLHADITVEELEEALEMLKAEKERK